MKAKIKKHTKEVEDTLNKLSQKNDKEKTAKLKKYIGTNLNVLGLLTKTQIDVCKNGFNFYTPLKESTFLLFNDIYIQSSVFEVKNLAFIYLDKNYKHISSKTLIATLPTWVKTIDNWAHSDNLSKYLSRLIEDNSTQNKMLSIIERWNVSKHLWERRQSLVSLYYYSRTKTNHVSFDLSIKFIFPLLTDKEYYVQKAVGWALRECYNVYPKQTFLFIVENINSITPIAFTTCIEKMSIKEKEILKEKRKRK